MIEFYLSELRELCKGTLQGEDLIIKAVSTDSRNCRGALFVALRGERFDAHDFVKAAVANGAVAVAVSRDVGRVSVPVLLCQDTLRLLGFCGLCVRKKSLAKVVSLTGSCGKTTVKELTAGILSLCGNTVSTRGNFNNDVGVPLTLLEINKDTEYAVIEQGASHLQDIARTCEFVQSDVALINNAGSAHIEGFGSKKGVYLGKSEILQDVFKRGGVGIVPSDSEWIEYWKSDFGGEYAQGRLLTFGTHEDDFVRLMSVKTGEEGISFVINADGKIFKTSLPLLGSHNAMNAAAACALALCAGAKHACLKQGLEKYQPMQGRLCVKHFGSFTLIDDAYNASFNAVLAAADVLSGCHGHKVMILGDMGELGTEAASLHIKAGEYAKGRTDELWCLGELTKQTCAAFGHGAKHFDSHEDLIKEACELALSDLHACFLVKGSHAMHMDLVNQALIKLGEKQ